MTSERETIAMIRQTRRARARPIAVNSVNSAITVITVITVLGALCMSGGAHAQPGGVIGGPGPDVIVGELPDTFSYGTQPGTGVFAYDIGTESCNAGSSNIAWFANTNQHPVIAQNVYRLKDGRFEQIGMAWVKHGFAALAGNACQIGCNGQGGTVLGVGCSDPYTFGINGLQTGLGPRSDINAFTGAFPYPYNAPGFSGVLARRVQIGVNDLDPALNAGAVYFAEGIYITPDDALSGNTWNNASYRRMQFANDAMRTASYVALAPTRRGKPAIYGWQEMDPAVRVLPIDVPGDGQVYIAQRVTEISPGLWRYQFAVENLSSDRSVRALEIGAAASATMSGATFRAPEYHSGEPLDNTAWTNLRTAGGVRWETSTFAALPTASALRWATTYAFGFESNARPEMGTVHLEMFKPGAGGAPSAVRVPMLTPGGGSLPSLAAQGDSCAAPLIAHTGVNGFTTLGASSDGPTACGTPGADEINSDVWWRYTFADTCSGTMTVSTCGSTFDTVLAVYLATCPSGAGQEIACNDDAPSGSCVGSTASGTSSVSFNAIPGGVYFIRVGSRLGESGHVVLTIAPPRCAPPAGACCFSLGGCQIVGGADGCMTAGGVWQGDLTVCSPNPCPQPPAPPNNLCANAIDLGDVLVGGAIVQGTNVNGSTDGTIACEGGGRDVWYRYTPRVSESVTVDLCATPATSFSDTVLQVLTGSCAGTAAACNDDFCGARSSATFSATAGTAYLIRVMGFGGTSGAFHVRVTGGGGTSTGACCTGVTCSLTERPACSGPNTRFAGASTVCNPPGNALSPCCKADFNQNGSISVQDVFDYLDAWFAGRPEANFNGGSGTPTVQSVFDYLNAWFQGGC